MFLSLRVKSLIVHGALGSKPKGMLKSDIDKDCLNSYLMEYQSKPGINLFPITKLH